MKKQPRIFAALFGVFLGCIVASNAHALPTGSVTFTGFGVGTLADVNFSVTAGPVDFTYSYQVFGTTKLLSLKMDLVDFVTISSASGNNGTTTTVTSDFILFNFSQAPSDTTTFDLEIISPDGPGAVGSLLNTSFLGSGVVSPPDSLIGPAGTPAPEPGTLLLLGSGLLGLAGLGRKKFLRHVKKD